MTTSSDLEDGMAVERTTAFPTLSRPEKPSTTGSLAVPANVVTIPQKFKNLIAQKFKKLITLKYKDLIKTMLSRIFRSFNLTKKSTQQQALLLLCVAGIMLDPLFFYIPMINEVSKCMKSDRKLGVIAISLRSLVDVLHLVQWSFYYKKKWKEISRGNPNSFSPRNSKVIDQLIETICILPLPQVSPQSSSRSETD